MCIRDDELLTFMQLLEGDVHGLEDGVVGGDLLEEGVQRPLRLRVPAQPEQRQRHQRLAALEVGLLLQHLLRLLERLLVVPVVQPVCAVGEFTIRLIMANILTVLCTYSRLQNIMSVIIVVSLWWVHTLSLTINWP